MDKFKPKEREITYRNTWPAVTHTVNGKRYSHRSIAVELRVINGKMEDVIINGAHFILDVNHGIRGDREGLEGAYNGKT